MPVHAVKFGGKPALSLGSSITIAGIILGWAKIRFVSTASSVIKPARPVSEPVPAVVGTAITGAMLSLLILGPPSTFTCRSKSLLSCP